jgi:hexosaminidase
MATIENSWTPGPKGAVFLKLVPTITGAEESPEGYTLKIGQNVEVTATDTRGLLWGVQTLLQAIDTTGQVPTLRHGEILDQPAHVWRAVLLDPARSFLDLGFLRRTIRVMSAYKLNILHLHLIDDEAWRFESKTFPKCNRPGELFYTQNELRELVAFAARYGVEIVPEFDFPGHSMTAVEAYPALDCEGQSRGINQAILCAGKPFTWTFIEQVVAEAAAVFPSSYLHLGADEPYAIKRWATCPDCQARMKSKGVTTTAALYHTFVDDLNEIAKRQGKKLILWNDAIQPGVEPMPTKEILIDAWVDYDKVEALAKEGYTLVNSSRRPLYLSSFGLREGYPLGSVWQWTTASFGVDSVKPVDQGLSYQTLSGSARILGGQASAWGTEQGLVERRLYPRALAVAERLWSGTNKSDFADFQSRLDAGHIKRLRALGVPDDSRSAEVLFDGTGLGHWIAFGQTKVTVEGDTLNLPGSANSGWLKTKRSYQDFILTFERQAVVPTDHSGVFIRCAPASGVGGSVDGLEVLTIPPSRFKKNVRELQGWKQFEIVARGRVVSLTINGILVWSVSVPAVRTGVIVLQGTASGLAFRNIKVRLLEASSSN